MSKGYILYWCSHCANETSSTFSLFIGLKSDSAFALLPERPWVSPRAKRKRSGKGQSLLCWHLMQIRHDSGRQQEIIQCTLSGQPRRGKLPLYSFFRQLFFVERSTLVTVLFSMSLFPTSEWNNLFLHSEFILGVLPHTGIFLHIDCCQLSSPHTHFIIILKLQANM